MYNMGTDPDVAKLGCCW